MLGKVEEIVNLLIRTESDQIKEFIQANPGLKDDVLVELDNRINTLKTYEDWIQAIKCFLIIVKAIV